MNICNTCANIRSMNKPPFQSVSQCELCGVTAICFLVKIEDLRSASDAFSEKGYFNSKDLSQLLALIKSRKAILAPRIKELQVRLSRPYMESCVLDDVEEVNELVEAGQAKRSIAGALLAFNKLKKIVGKWGPSDASTKVILSNLIAEQSGLKEKEAELSILYKNTLDFILLDQLKFRVGNATFNKCFEEAKEIYRKRNNKGK